MGFEVVGLDVGFDDVGLGVHPTSGTGMHVLFRQVGRLRGPTSQPTGSVRQHRDETL